MPLRFMYAALASSLLTGPVSAGQINKAFVGKKIELHVNNKYATKLPITFECRIENDSRNPWWLGGIFWAPGPRLDIADERGKKQRIYASNGVNIIGSFQPVRLLPTESVTIPFAIQNLPAGKYTLVIQNKIAREFEVVDDASLRTETVKAFVAGFWSKDTFCKHFISKLANDASSRDIFQTIDPELYRAMHSDDEDKAVYVLTFLYVNFSALSSDRVERELHDSVVSQQRKNAERPHQKWTRFFASAAALAGRIKSDKALSLVLTILEKEGNRPNGGAAIRFAAVRSLSDFKQEKAVDELARIAGEAPWGISGDQIICEAAHQLCIKKDPRALGILYQLYNKEQFRARKGKLLWSATALYDNPGADPFIRMGLEDADPQVRGAACEAQDRLALMRQTYLKK